ncbi:MAG: hypothetical protein ACI8RE_001343 [Ilumatobacter sp.]
MKEPEDLTMRHDLHKYPSPELVLSLRYDEPAVLVPDELLAFVVPVLDDGKLYDWKLTSDAVAFGDIEVPQMFDLWRSSWEHSWVLDPMSSLECLVSIASGITAETGHVINDVLGRAVVAIARGNTALLGTLHLQQLAEALEALRDAVRAREIKGFGFINATPGYAGAGLARAWSPSCGPEVLAADRHLAVFMEPETGLGINLREKGERITGVTSVEIFENEVQIDHVGASGRPVSTCLQSNLALPLAWVVSATKWHVVEVPEELVWARTVAGLVECSQMALATGGTVRLMTTASIIADVSSTS